MIKTVTLTGAEAKVSGLGGFNTVVHNLGGETLFASKYPGVAEGADNVAEIPAGAAKLISTTNGTVYLLGTGKAELTGQDHDGVNFRQPSLSKGDGGGNGVSKDYVDKSIASALEKANGGNADTVNGHTVNADVPADAKFTDTTYSAATQSKMGLMTAVDKRKLDGIEEGANNYTLPLAAASERGGAKIGYTANGKNYPVKLSNEQMYVNVPWTDTTYSVMSGATEDAKGAAGLVPAPAKGAQAKYLRGDGTWQTPPDTNTTYSIATADSAGLFSINMFNKLASIDWHANNYIHPETAGNKHIPSGGRENQILTYDEAGTAKWSGNCYAAAIAVNSGHSLSSGVMVAYKAGRTRALILFYHTGIVSSTDNATFGRASLSGLSDNMTAKPDTVVMNGLNSHASYSVASNGNIILSGSADIGYVVIWFN